MDPTAPASLPRSRTSPDNTRTISALQLTMWQASFRKNSLESMADIAKRLSEDDIAAVAAYYQQLRDATREPAQPGK